MYSNSCTFYFVGSIILFLPDSHFLAFLPQKKKYLLPTRSIYFVFGSLFGVLGGLFGGDNSDGTTVPAFCH